MTIPMIIRINIGFLPTVARSKLINFLITQFQLEQSYSDNDDIISLNTTSGIQTIKKTVESILTEICEGYIITENIHAENEIVVLKKGDLEQLDIYICIHCGMPFESEGQRSIHQRIHYF
jgi:F0F1-type ATP synthase epsilon subunit